MNARPITRGGFNALRVEHSPGPWHSKENETRTAVKALDGRTVAYANILPETDFNVSLMKSAPDLLRLAIQYASECGECAGVGIQPDNSPCPDCKFIRDVIARATGVP